jgi:hypothetical protein
MQMILGQSLLKNRSLSTSIDYNEFKMIFNLASFTTTNRFQTIKLGTNQYQSTLVFNSQK